MILIVLVMANNLKEAKELLEIYKSITLEQLMQKYELLTPKHFRFRKGEYVLGRMTYFGTHHCIICRGAKGLCKNCIYSFRIEENKWDIPCVDITYKEMRDATSAEELFNAIQKRISYLNNVIQWYELQE
jgi:hypothetical protein